MEFNRLNHDVLFEIFLNFVTIDWDGPFTLILVCSKWCRLVTSKPRLWTWIMIDDSQPDWKDRVDVAAYLSKGLPLQAVLRTPFTSKNAIYDVKCRLTTLFIDSNHSYFDRSPQHSLPDPMIRYETFREHQTTFEDIDDSIMCFLSGIPSDTITILSGDKNRACFAYSTWSIYEELLSGGSLKEYLETHRPLLVTTLVFNATYHDQPRRALIPIIDIWELLPTLPHLNYLELCDNVIKMDKTVILPPITLPSLMTLNIECPMNHWILFSFENDIWLGLFSLLDSLCAPVIETMVLHGSIQRITAVLIKGGFKKHLQSLTLSISIFDEASDIPEFDPEWVWLGLKQLTVGFPRTTNAFHRMMNTQRIQYVVWLLVNLAPTQCSCQLIGGNELYPAINKVGYGSSGFKWAHILYNERGSGMDWGAWNEVKPLPISHLTLTTALSSSLTFLTWFRSAEHVVIETENNLTIFFAQKLPILTNAISLDTGTFSITFVAANIPNSTEWEPEEIFQDRFKHLRSLRCELQVAEMMIRRFKLPNLESLTLTRDFFSSNPLREAFSVAVSLPRVSVQAIETIPSWTELLHLIRDIRNYQEEGISVLKLPGLPHPSILRVLVDELGGGVTNRRTDYIDRGDWGYIKGGMIGCLPCCRSGWSCYDDRCTRFSTENMVSITKDTVIGRH